MNIFYEESGQFKVASIVQKNDATYQVDTQHGKRTKVKANHVFVTFQAPMDAFLAEVQALAADIDTGLLWEVCSEAEFSAEAIAADYFGHKASEAELAATLMALYAAPMYFYKKGKGVFKAAPADVLQQALAAIERKQQQEAQVAAWVAELQAGSLPEAMAADLQQILHAPDKQSLSYKAFARAADAQKLSLLALARQVGGVPSVPQYLLDGFLWQHFPKGTGFAAMAAPVWPDLPRADATVQAFSIDDADTTEIDDALSVRDLPDGGKRVGIHIAVPSIAIAADSPMEQMVFQRLSTVYYPGGKITMLPPEWVAAFSLDAGAYRPALSMYVDVAADFSIIGAPQCCLEQVYIADNLRIQAIEPHFNHQTGTTEPVQAAFAHHEDLVWLLAWARQRLQARGKYDPTRPPQYDYSIELDAAERVSIGVRERGSPVDTVVSEMMILANSTWAQMLHEAQLPALFRVQPAGKVRLSTRSEPHIGMGVPHYAWCTSPLRRAADYVNQKQLLALIVGEEPRYQENDSMLFALLRDFDTTYTAYADFQRQMEHYWSLVYLQQEDIREISVVLLRDDLVRVDGLPMVARATGIPIDALPKSRLRLAVNHIDLTGQTVALQYLNAVVPPKADAPAAASEPERMAE